MNENYQKWFQSGQMVDRKLDENLQIVQTIAGLNAYHQELKDQLTLIAHLDQILNRDSTAQTFVKNKSREMLINILLNISRQLRAAGHVLNNGILEKSSKLTSTSLKNSSDATLIARGRNILDLIIEFFTDLGHHGVGQPEKDQLMNLIDEYSRISLEPKYTKAEHRENKKKMEEVFGNFKSTVRSIDIVVETTRISYPDFYRAIRELRKLGSNRSSNINIVGKIFEPETRQPVNNVKIMLIPEVQDMKNVEMMVTNRSGFRIKNLDSGFYTLKAQKPGYRDFEQRVTIISNEKNTVEIFLEKIA